MNCPTRPSSVPRYAGPLRADVLQKRDGTREVAGYGERRREYGGHGRDGFTDERNGKTDGRDGDEV